MGSASALESPGRDDDWGKQIEKKLATESKKETKTVKKDKKKPAESIIEEPALRKRPRRAAACSNFKEEPFQILKESDLIEKKKSQSPEEESVAIALTAGQESDCPNRRLVDYIFHKSDGIPQPLEMLEVDDIFFSGTILPLEGSVDKD